MQINIAKRAAGEDKEWLPRAWDRRVLLICAVLALVTFCIYSPVLQNGFVNFDDHTYVTDNAPIQNGLTPTAMVWAFTTGHASNWHPLTWISHIIDWQLYGQNHPGGHHLTNLLFHIANTLLLFIWLNRITGKTWRSAAVAALFAWHPLHVESVAWIAERKDVLSTFFWLLTMLAFQQFKVRGSKFKVCYSLALLFFTCGLMSKPMLVTLPFVLLLLDYWPRKRSVKSAECGVGSAELGKTEGAPWMSWKNLVIEKVPFFLLALVSSVITFLVQQEGGAVMAVENLSLGQRLATPFLAYAGYLRKMFWPSGLAVFYPLPGSVPAAQVIFAVLLLAVISASAIALARSRPYALFGWLWFLGTLVPVIGLVQVGSQSMADRYTYMPLVGLFIVVVWGVADLFTQGKQERFALAWFIFIVMAAACLCVTWEQTQFWKDSETLFRRDLAVVPDNALAHVNLGSALDGAGHPVEAEAQFQAALRLEPDSALSLNGLGVLYAHEGDVTNTIKFYNSALRNHPFFSDAHYNLGNALAAQGKYEEAAQHYLESLRTKDDSPDAHNNLGAVLMRLGRWPDALAQFKAALRLKPNYPEAQDQMGSVLLKLGHPDLAEIHYAEAVRLKPDFAHAQSKLGLALAQQGQLEAALNHLGAAVKLEPKNPETWFDLAAVLDALKRFDDAAEAFAQSVVLKPGDANARLRLAESLASGGRQAEAIQGFQEALRVQPDSPDALRGAAWILATSKKSELRNGAVAVRLAERANGLTGGKDPAVLSALDAAYAEAGRFEEAIKTAEQVRQLATAQNQNQLADKAAQRLELYRAGKAFRE